MNFKTIFRNAFLVIFVLSIGASFAFGQGIFGQIKDRVKSETGKQKGSIPKANNPLNTSGFKWARIETRVSWQDRAQTKYETRVYYSNVSPYQVGDAKMVENLAKYFEKGIVEPLKQRGIEVKFYDSDITIYPPSYSYETPAEAEKGKEERMIDDKDAKYAIYSFIWKYNGNPNGEEMTQPKRIFSVKDAPKSENAVVEDSSN